MKVTVGVEGHSVPSSKMTKRLPLRDVPVNPGAKHRETRPGVVEPRLDTPKEQSPHPMKVRIKLLQIFRRGLPALVAGLALAPVAIVWDSLPAASASNITTSTSLYPVALIDASSPTLRAKVTADPSDAGTPTGTVSFAIHGSGPVQCDGLATNTVAMSGGVATCKITSVLPASTSPETAQAIYGADDTFAPSVGTYTSNDGTFTSGVDPTTTTTTTTTTPPPSGGMAAPAGYTNQQLIFDDQFSGTRLDTAKWTTLMGAQGVVWNNHGTLPAGYTGRTAAQDKTAAPFSTCPSSGSTTG